MEIKHMLYLLVIIFILAIGPTSAGHYKKKKIIIHVPVKSYHHKHTHTIVKDVHHHHEPKVIKEKEIIKHEIHEPIMIKEEIEHEHLHHHYKHEHPEHKSYHQFMKHTNIDFGSFGHS